MNRSSSFGRLLGLLLVFLAVACSATPDHSSSHAAGSVQSASASPKRLLAAMLSNPPTISSRGVESGNGTIQGGETLEELVNNGLSSFEPDGRLAPRLAEAVPTIDNGLWQVDPDGSMTTTWHLKPGIVWHDGVAFTADDLVFAAQLSQDPDLPFFRYAGIDLVDSVEATDPSTVVVRWRRAYISADEMFTLRFALPRPAHVLDQPYRDAKESIPALPYWTSDYVGTGPFRVGEWVSGSHLMLEANDRYLLGRPKIDEIEVRFIPDPNALIANLLAGTAEMTFDRSLDVANAMQIRDQWRGTYGVRLTNWFALWPQLLNPTPALLQDVRLRRALLYSLDRQQMADSLQYGLAPVADAFLSPTESAYNDIQSQIVRYLYDPRQASQLYADLGYNRGPDGMLLDQSGLPLTLDVRTNAGDEGLLLAIANDLRTAGVDAQPFLIPDVQRSDREANSTFPGVRLWRLPNDLNEVQNFQSKEAPMPENHFTGNNRSRYMNPAFDALIDRYTTTISETARTQVLGQIVHQMTDQLTTMGIYYNAEIVFIGERLRNVGPAGSAGGTSAYNAQDWDLS